MSLVSQSRRRRGAAVIAALAGGVLASVFIAPAGQALPALPAPATITGVVQDSATNTIPGACVYPYVSGNFNNGLGGTPGSMGELLPGACADADGNFSVPIPAPGYQGAQVTNLVVVAGTSYVGAFANAIDGATITLQPAAATVSGAVVTTVSGSLTPVPSAVAEVADMTSGEILGITLTDNAGNFTMGVLPATNGPGDTVGVASGLPLGKGSSPDLVGTASLNPPTPGASLDAGQIVIPDFSEIQGHVTVDGTTAEPFQVVSAQCGPCNSNSYALTDANGNYSLLVPLGITTDVAAGSNHVSVVASQPVVTMPDSQTVPAGKIIGAITATPTTWLTPGGIWLNQTVTWNWSGASLIGAPDAWLRSTATATWKSALTKYPAATPEFLQSRTVKLALGSTMCQKVATQANDAIAGVSNIGAATTSCFTVPLDDRAFKSSTGWKRLKSTKSFMGTVTYVSKAKSTLTLTGVTGSTLSVLWSRATKGGSFTVSVNGKVVKTISTKGATALSRITTLPKKAMKAAKVVITTTSSSPVAIDGLAVQP